MSAINVGRVIVGGLVSGIVLLAGDACVNEFILKDEFNATFTRLNIDVAAMHSTSGLVSWIASDLIFGMVLMWTYAAIRPRFGPGPRTALVAALLLFVTVTLVFYGLTSMGVFTESLFIKNTLLYAVIMSVAALAGGALYKED